MTADAASRPTRRTVLRAGTALTAAAGLTACADGRHAALAAQPGSAPAATVGAVAVGDAAAATAPDWAALAHSLHGPLIRPGDSRYTAAQHLFQPRYDSVHPAAVAYPASATDVAACVSFARRYRLPLSARNGGHSYGGWSKAAGGLVVDLGKLSSVRTVPGGAVVGAGARLVDVYSQLNAHGVTIPAGSCPTVGVTGLTLGGGVGVTGRAYGLTCDSLTGAQIVTAAGQVLDVDASHHADLFWALRGGGGGNFGIVTQLRFRTHPAPDCAYAFLSWDWSQAAAVIRAWQAWAPSAPDRLWANLHLSASSDGRLRVASTCVMVGGAQAQLAAQIRRLTVRPASVGLHSASFFRTMQVMGGVAGESVSQAHVRGPLPGQTANGLVGRSSYGSRSDFYTRPLSTAGARAVVAAVARYPRTAPAGGRAAVAFDALGGAINRVPTTATAFAHRNGLFLAQYTADYPAGVTGGTAADRSWAWLDGTWNSLRGYASGAAYQNYLDPHLKNWAQAYYGPNLARLQAVKHTYDPTNLFHFPQSIPLPR